METPAALTPAVCLSALYRLSEDEDIALHHKSQAIFCTAPFCVDGAPWPECIFAVRRRNWWKSSYDPTAEVAIEPPSVPAPVRPAPRPSVSASQPTKVSAQSIPTVRVVQPERGSANKSLSRRATSPPGVRRSGHEGRGARRRGHGNSEAGRRAAISAIASRSNPASRRPTSWSTIRSSPPRPATRSMSQVRRRTRRRARKPRRADRGASEPYPAGQGFAPQIPVAYSWIVRSLENLPEAAMLRMTLRAQASGLR